MFNLTLLEATVIIRTLVTILTAVLCTLVSTHAHADKRVTVHDFYGPNANRVRDDVVNLLERQSGVTIISKGQIESTALKLGVDPYSPGGRIALGRELQLSAWMTGVVRRRSGQLKLTVVVFDGAKHTTLGRARLAASGASKLGQAIKQQLWRKTRSAIMRSSPPAATEDPNAVADSVHAPEIAADGTAVASRSGASLRDDAENDGGDDEVASTGRGRALRAFLGLGSPYRSLAYSSPITSSLGDFSMSGAPMLDVNVAFHPAAPFTDGFASWIGFDLRGQLALATPSVDRDGNKFKSSYNAFHAGLRLRVPVATHYVSAFSGYGRSQFAFSSEQSGGAAPTPSVEYEMIRTGAGAELALSDELLFGVDGAWLQFLGVGDIGKWFPRATAGGFELAASGTYALTQGVFMRLSASYQRLAFDFNSRPDDQYRAAGATDQYLSVSVGAGVKL